MSDTLESYADQNNRLRSQVKRLKREKEILISACILHCPDTKNKAMCLCTDDLDDCKCCWNAWLRRKMKEG